MPFLVQLAISFALQLIGYLIMPKPPQEKPGETKDMEKPTAKSGMVIPKVFGTVTVKGLNTVGYADLVRREVDVD